MKHEERLFFQKLRVGKARERDERWLRLRTRHWGCHSTVLGRFFFFSFFLSKKKVIVFILHGI